MYPDVLNGLATDALYPEDSGSEPERSEEILQTWDAIKSLNQDLVDDSIKKGLEQCRRAVTRAGEAYDEVEALVARLDQKSNRDHLAALSEGIRLFTQLAELDNIAFDAE